MPFTEGFAYGLATILLIGPVFFTLLKAALDHGFNGGLAVAVGIIMGDILVVVICMTGSVAFLEQQMDSLALVLVAGSILLLLGLKYLIRPNLDTECRSTLRKRDALSLISAGFLVNFVNPFVFVIWIGLTMHAGSTFGEGTPQWHFLIGALCAIFFTDIIKAALAPKLRSVLNRHVLTWVYRIIGVVMIGFAIRVFLLALI